MVGDFIVNFVSILFDLMSFAILARILMSWLPSGGGGRVRSFLHDVTEPVLGPFRRVIPRLGMLDISPIVAIIALDLLRSIVIQLLIPILGV